MPLPDNRAAAFLFRASARTGDAGWRSPVARQAHNLKVAGANPAPATNKKPASERAFLLSALLGRRRGLRGFPLHAHPYPALDRGVVVEQEFLDRVWARVTVLGRLHERARQGVGPV